MDRWIAGAIVRYFEEKSDKMIVDRSILRIFRRRDDRRDDYSIIISKGGKKRKEKSIYVTLCKCERKKRIITKGEKTQGNNIIRLIEIT